MVKNLGLVGVVALLAPGVASAAERRGAIVAFGARQLKNGTLAGAKLRIVGRAKSFHVRGLVVGVRRATRVAVLLARGAVLSCACRNAAAPRRAPAATQVREVNPSASAGEISGRVTAVGSDSITVSDGGVSVTMSVPAGFDVSKYTVGTDVLAYFVVASDGSYTLKAIGANGSEAEADDAGEIEGDVAAAEQEVETEDEAGDGESSVSGSSEEGGSASSAGDSGSSSGGSGDD